MARLHCSALMKLKGSYLASVLLTILGFYLSISVVLPQILSALSVKIYAFEAGFPPRKTKVGHLHSETVPVLDVLKANISRELHAFNDLGERRGTYVPRLSPRPLNWKKKDNDAYHHLHDSGDGKVSPKSEDLPQCQKLIHGDVTEHLHAKRFMSEYTHQIRSNEDIVMETTNCTRYVRERGFFLAASQEEQDFPIAYSIVFYRDIDLLEKLLRAIYRPHNVYCIHVDRKSPSSTLQAVKSLVSCLRNVFIASRILDVQWGTFAVLEAELVCMKDVWKDTRWRYFINLTGQEFPLKTSWQLVKILTALNGSNVVDCTTNTRYNERWYNSFSPPHGIKPLKGNLHAVLSRGFVDFVLHDPRALDFLKWVKVTDVPDETLFATLNHNPQLSVPGAYLGPPDTDAELKPYIARFKNWGHNWYDGQGRQNFNWPCYGKRVRNICVFGVGDLPMLTSRMELFANKFHVDFEPVVLECLEEWLYNMTVEEYSGNVDFDVSFYRNLDIVKNRIEPKAYPGT